MESGNKTLVEQQVELERQMVERGHERHNERQEKLTGSKQEAPHKSIAEAIQKVSFVITKSIEEDEKRFSSGMGKESVWYHYLKEIDPDVLSYLGLNTCYDAVTTGKTYGQTLAAIGARIENEIWAKLLKAYDKVLFKRLVLQVTKDHSSEKYRFRAAKNIATKEGFRVDKWTNGLKTHIGSPILNAIFEAVDIFEITEHVVSKPVTKGRKLNVKNHRHISITKEAEQLIKDDAFKASWLSPMFGPLLVRPKAWTAFDTGIYQSEELSSLVPLVRASTFEQKNAVKHDLKQEQEPAYVTALNALNAVPFKVNKHIVEAIEWCNSTPGLLVGLEDGQLQDYPMLEVPEYPPYPDDPDNYDEKYLHQVIADRRKWHEIKREVSSNVCVMHEDLKTLNTIKDQERFYLGWSTDTRGRLYPVSFYNYYRADHIRATFLFAEGKKVDKTAQGWVMIQLANCGDFDKISKAPLEDRIDWVLQNEEMILAVANDYKANFDKWARADKPFMFLSACIEYKQMIEDPDNFVSHLPCNLDGTNSGTQHYALALTHEDGALVNLVPSDTCQDVYQVVADAVIVRLKSETDPMAKVWLKHGITRKTVKRNTMCFGYNSKKQGMGDQIIEDLMEPLQKQKNYGKIKEHPFGDSRDQVYYARYLAGINYEVIGETLSCVSTGMDFLQAHADALAREGKSVRWTTPSGFPAVQKYTKTKAKRVRVFLYDRQAKMRKETRVNYGEDTDQVDTRKSRSGIAANYIHSLDASHMVLSIISGLDNGITNFFMIHDSFGTLPSDTWQFYHCIRNTLVDIYDDNCVFTNFANECKDRLSDPNREIAKLPPKGNLDVKAVRESEYCFS